MKLLQVTLLFILLQYNLFSQPPINKGDFRKPVDIDFKISSSFGEIRPNHFHAGFDVYTFVKPGINYYSIADGYISRIKVSSRGLGKAIYITHPNGYVSVYAHMSKFRFDIDEYIYKLQHSMQEFYQDIYLSPSLFPLKSGDYIGKSGNTGNSFGAHLHLEIREADTEIPINPIQIFNVEDKVKPRINGVYIYRFDDDKKRYVKSSLLKNINGKTIKTFGKTGFGLEIHDYKSNSHNVFGTYQVQMFVDDSLCFAYKMEKISFDETRYLNSFVDYERYKSERKKITKCFIEPNNKLGIYTSKGNGILNFSDNEAHLVKIVGSDFKGNKNTVEFVVLSDSTKTLVNIKSDKNVVKYIDCLKENSFQADSFRVFFPLNSLYHDIDLKYFTSANKYSSYSRLHNLHNRYIPIHKGINIKIKPNKISSKLRDKALIAGISKRGNIYALNSKWDGDFLTADIHSFGSYFVSIDSIKPKIKALSFSKNKTVKSNNIKFKITDNLSGVKEYIAYIDNKWVLFEYDQKNNLIECNLSKEKIKKGEHILTLWVEDYCGNITDVNFKFNYQ